MRAPAAFVALTLVVLTSLAATAGEDSDATAYSQLALVPDDASARANPLETDPDAVKTGKKLFDRHCANCHGAAGESGKKGPSLLVPEIQTASSGALFWVITHGNVRAGMPVWSKLPEPQRWQITTYLKSLAVATGPQESTRALGR
jgi:mono/diheme cytochrome c family protein